jgi:hypothetical protein
LRITLKRDAPEFTSDQFFPLRRGDDFATAAGDGLAEAQDFEQIPSSGPMGNRIGGEKRLPRRGLRSC